jgi:hypothetical protein
MQTGLTLAQAQAVPNALLRQLQSNGTWTVYELGDTLPQPTVAQLLAVAKAARIQADREACAARLTEHYGSAEEQVSRSLGVYGVQAKDNMLAGIQATIDASNAARDLINAATTVAQVEAVTVAWPVLT